jgi:N-acetyl-beta-hexosaminidase
MMYSYDPLAGLTTEQSALVLGGETHAWGEQTDASNADTTVWPRAAAAAEVLWSGRQDANGVNRTQLNATPRLAELRERLIARGIDCGPIQAIYCSQNNATVCME